MSAAMYNRVPFWAMLGLGVFAYLLRSIDYFNALPGDLGDARFNSVILEHLFRWVTGQEPDLWSPPFFFPVSGTLAFSDNHFGSGPFYVLFRLLGADREIAFDLWFATGVVLNYVAFYYMGRRLGLSAVAAALGAFVYAFALPALAKENHAQLTYRFAAPLAFLAMWRVLETRRLLLLWQVALWTAIQFYCSIYLGLFLLFLLLATVGVAVLRHPRKVGSGMLQTLRQEPRLAAVLSAVAVYGAIASIGALLNKYYAVGKQYGFSRSPDELATMLPRLSSYLLSTREPTISWLAPFLDLPMKHEHQLFLGFGAWLLVLAGLFAVVRDKSRRSLGGLAAGVLVALFVLTLSVGGYSLYLFVAKMAGIGSIPVVSRIILIMLLPLAIVAATGVDWLMERRNSAPGLLVIAFAALVMAAETALYRPHNSPVQSWLAEVAETAAALPSVIAEDAVLYVTSSTEKKPYYITEITGMIVAQDLGKPTLNGYSGHIPPGFIFADACVTPKARLDAYVQARTITEARAEKVLGRVVYVPLELCPDDG